MRPTIISQSVTRRSVMVGGLALLAARRAQATPPASVTMHEWRTLVQMARDLFPHTRLPNAVYESIVARRVAQNVAVLKSGVQTLDGTQKPSWSRRRERLRLTQLKSIEATPFFQDMRATVMFGLYGDLSVTRRFGYQGPSLEEGGYLQRGFNDLNWLPEPA
jgi:hypothetical protein